MTKKRNLNALKHGAFSEPVFLPEEDPEEFKKIHDAVIDEWDPVGPTECDKVLSVAMNMWRKRRVRSWVQNGLDDAGVRTFLVLNLHGLDKIRIPVQFLKEYREGGLNDITEDNIATKVGEFWAGQLKQIVPRNKYEDDNSWRGAVADRLLFLDKWDLPAFGGLKNIQDSFSDPEFATNELAFEERIDAKIARDLKELGQLKTMKAIGLGNRRKTSSADLPKITAPSMQREGEQS